MTELAVSIIIPTYNRAHLIVRSLRSVLSALGPLDEVIVVDDGSTDATLRVLEPYRDRIRYVVGPHRGVGAARNCGITNACKPLVAFNDSDDEWCADKLALQRAFMEARADVLFCFSDFGLKDEDGTESHHGLLGWYRDLHDKPRTWDEVLGPAVAYSSVAALPQGRADFNVHIGNLYDAMLMTNHVASPSAVVRRERAGDALRFPEDIRAWEDYECFTRLAKVGTAAYFDCETIWQCGHTGPRLSGADAFYRATCRITALQRTFGVDEQFLRQHWKGYVEILRAQYLARFRYLIRRGRQQEAREELQRVGGAPLTYRLLASMPGPLTRAAASLYHWMR